MEKVNAFKYERNLFKVEFNSGTVGLWLLKIKQHWKTFIKSEICLKMLKALFLFYLVL